PWDWLCYDFAKRRGRLMNLQHVAIVPDGNRALVKGTWSAGT
ncbi:unnamed protein product, partial [marine sediment metagenome]